MASLHLNLPGDLKSRLQTRALESGYDTIEQYAEAVLQASAADDLVDDDIESLISERLNDPGAGIELTDDVKQQLRQQINQRRNSTRK
jgi:plasmid stability protein